jgi:hypothetical protein
MSEQIFYDDGTNKVTDKRFVTAQYTYAIDNIESVGREDIYNPPVYEDQGYTRPKTREEIKEERKKKPNVFISILSALWEVISGGLFGGLFLAFFALFLFALLHWIFGWFEGYTRYDSIYYGIFFGVVFLSVFKSVSDVYSDIKIDPIAYRTKKVCVRDGYYTYRLNIRTSAGYGTYISFTNESEIQQIVKAFNSAIAA